MAASQADQQEHIVQLEQRLQLLNLIIYGRKSEKKPRTGQEQQLSLFDEAEQTAEEHKPQTFVEACAPASTRRKRGRRPIPAALPRVEIIHDLPESEEACACGACLVRIGEEVSEKLDIVPAKIQVIRHIRPKYACRTCEGVEDDGPTVKTAPMPPQIIPQGIVTPGLLAHVAVAKYADTLPLYRQEDQFARLGLDISRGTLAGWMIRVAKACEPLIDMIIAAIRSGPIVNMDETTVQVLAEPGRANTTKSFMWVARGGTPGKPVVLFRYHPSRAGNVAAEILGDFKGYLQTDGYSGYEALGEREGLRHLGCLAHVRRKFVEVEKSAGKKAKGSTAHAVLDLIGKLYGVEHQAEKQQLNPEQIKVLRAEKSRPILDKLKALLDARASTTPPKSLLGKAIGYALKQWDRLVVYLEDGRLRPDNNLAENAIRPFAVGRKNWLFSGHPRGADASAIIYSLIETAKANGLEPYRYLRHLFEHLPAATTNAPRKALLPQDIDPQSLIIPA
ncbi:IS66 family transposase [Solidesulfovibrio magneticus]|nr:IS66 family transposase [Solidesulfovibrio magneticus]